MVKKIIFLSCSMLIMQVYICSASLLRSGRNDASTPDDNKKRHRKLDWVFVPTGKVVKNNKSYDFYDDEEVPDNQGMNDAPDFLRTNDVCFKNGSFSKSNCPTPPNCNFTGKFGPAKACFNRFPRRDDKNKWYVGIMKCIPQWENCDKCVCGAITSDKGTSGTCYFTNQSPNDDTLSFSCSTRQTLKFQGYTWTAPSKVSATADFSAAISMQTQVIDVDGSDDKPAT